MTSRQSPAAKAAQIDKIPATAAAQVDIRIDGKLRLSALCYDVVFGQDEHGVVVFQGSLNPTLIDAPPPLPKERFGTDPRDGEAIITKVHSGRRDRGTT